MKKIIALTFISTLSTTAFAAPVGTTFVGVGSSIELTTVKYKANGMTKQVTSPTLVVDYGMDYGDNFVGIVQGKTKVGKSKLSGDVKQKNHYTLAYQQGYRVGADLLPYVKVDVNSSKIGNKAHRGFGYGAGVKYAVSSNVEIGAELTRTNLKRGGVKLKGNALTANVGYRF